MVAWQALWEEEREKGQWTRALIPQLKEWVECKHRRLDYFVTQVLTGHGSFRTYTKKIKKTENDLCIYCGDRDTPEHTLFVCNRWQAMRNTLNREVGVAITATNMVQVMVETKEGWMAIERYINRLMKDKEKEEKEVQLREREEEAG